MLTPLLLNANALHIPLSDKSVNCVVTSPPYWGLRDYGVPGQLGLERTPEEYVAHMVEVFREVWRVMDDRATLWLNLGDSYAVDQIGGVKNKPGDKSFTNKGGCGIDKRHPDHGLKPKDMVGIPWRVAFALQDDGWYLRSEIIWQKPNPMPESVTDRPTKSHEQIFLLSKSSRYYYDAEAILEPVSGGTHLRISQDVASQIGSFRANGGSKTNGPMKAVIRTPKQTPAGSRIKNNDSFNNAVCLPVVERNKRDVWTIATQSYSGAHFATFPPKLIEPCILAGCPAGGIVLDPFNGSGTTGEVSIGNNRRYVGLDLSMAYLDLSKERLSMNALDEWVNGRTLVNDHSDLPLFGGAQ